MHAVASNAAVSNAVALNGAGSLLHPLREQLAEGEIRFELKGATRPDETVVVECIYRPYRERDVRKKGHFHLFDSIWRIGSRDVYSVQRDEAHRVVSEARAVGSTLSFSVSLRATEPDFAKYQLSSIEVNRLRFGRWFAEAPALDVGFALDCQVDRLSGEFRAGGLGAAPLNGMLPLWSSLRKVELTVAPVSAPEVRLWESRTKHNWDGWRQTTPQPWLGGESIVLRQLDRPTIWRANEYFEFQPAEAPLLGAPMPPAGVLPGIALEVFWPEGAVLEFPDVHFGRPVDVLAVKLSRLTPRARTLLAQSVRLRPGLEFRSLSAEEWKELEALVDETGEAPAEFAMKTTPDGKDLMTAQRHALTEPWVYIFGANFDSERRFAVKAMLLSPNAWDGPLPE